MQLVPGPNDYESVLAALESPNVHGFWDGFDGFLMNFDGF